MDLERPKPVENGGEFLETKLGEVARRSVIEGGKTLLRDEIGDLLKSLGERRLAVQGVLAGVGEGQADGADLGGIDQLRDKVQVDFLRAKVE